MLVHSTEGFALTMAELMVLFGSLLMVFVLKIQAAPLGGMMQICKALYIDIWPSYKRYVVVYSILVIQSRIIATNAICRINSKAISYNTHRNLCINSSRVSVDRQCLIDVRGHVLLNISATEHKHRFWCNPDVYVLIVCAISDIYPRYNLCFPSDYILRSARMWGMFGLRTMLQHKQ